VRITRSRLAGDGVDPPLWGWVEKPLGSALDAEGVAVCVGADALGEVTAELDAAVDGGGVDGDRDDDGDSIRAHALTRLRLANTTSQLRALLTVIASGASSGPSQFWVAVWVRAVRARAIFARMDSAVAVQT
jgi:hypothetical protein